MKYQIIVESAHQFSDQEIFEFMKQFFEKSVMFKPIFAMNLDGIKKEVYQQTRNESADLTEDQIQQLLKL